MDTIIEALGINRLSDGAFMPHGMCYLWQPGILGLHVFSDALISLAYFSIPFTLVYFVVKRTDLGVTWIFACFAVFIVACGTTHLLEIATIWWPVYWLSGGVKAGTALASITTAVLLAKLVPAALRVPSPSALQAVNDTLAREVIERKNAEREVQRINATLEARVAERTAQWAAANGALTRSNARFAIASHAAEVGFWQLDLSQNAFEWDDTMFLLHGLPRNDGPVPFDVWAGSLHPEDRAASERMVLGVRNGCGPVARDYRVIHRDGQTRHLRMAFDVPGDGPAAASQAYGVAFDVTERKRAYELQQQMSALVESASDAILTRSLEGIVRSWNSAAEALLGYTAKEMIGQSMNRLIPEDRLDEESLILDRIKNGQQVDTLETVRRRKDGSLVDVSVTNSPVYGSGGDIVGISKIMRDITPQRQAAEALRALNTELEQRIRERTAQLKEREALLQEVHHRVKNNLQVISSLINMQIRSIADEAIGQALHECRSRVETMAQIHEMLYLAKDYARVPFARYATDLVNRVVSASGTPSTAVAIDFRMDELFLPVDKAIPCGLILNELISNALKHAFPGGAHGQILVELRQLTEHRVVLSVSDDGIGISPDFAPETAKSLGVQLVMTLVEQLDARLEIIRRPGTTFRMTFSIEPNR